MWWKGREARRSGSAWKGWEGGSVFGFLLWLKLRRCAEVELRWFGRGLLLSGLRWGWRGSGLRLWS